MTDGLALDECIVCFFTGVANLLHWRISLLANINSGICWYHRSERSKINDIFIISGQYTHAKPNPNTYPKP